MTNPDRAALVALYEATDGPNWVDSTNWLTDAPLGDWYGVETDASERVVRLELAGNGLSGRIPPELGRLANLWMLWLAFNELSGRIPPELGRLANLQTLWLADNELSGGIPAELGDVGSLETLHLYNNPLSGPLPLGLANLPIRGLAYSDTQVCVPNDQAFLAWLAAIPEHWGTGIVC